MSEPRNIVICCDGTNNEIKEDLSNIIKLYRILKNDPEQILYYDIGIGTVGKSGNWDKLKNKASAIWGMATGAGLDENVLDAYKFLMNNYQDGDKVYIFGFSRGAYTARVLAGFIRLIGLLKPRQSNLVDYAFTTYKQASLNHDFEIAYRFRRILDTDDMIIHFLGLFDTVSSVFIANPQKTFGLPKKLSLPYTTNNDSVKIVRHAVSIDEKRGTFVADLWGDEQQFKTNPFDRKPEKQDVKEVWFAGVHSDVGGGYSELDSGVAKIPLKWMLDEAVEAGLHIRKTMYNRIINGHEQKSRNTKNYVAADPLAKIHNSVKGVFIVFNLFKKGVRKIPENALIHKTVEERMNKLDYNPPNLPAEITWIKEGQKIS